jgi:DNA repair exonuclease SbcCD nuclease subunit
VKRLIVTDTHLGLYQDSDKWLDIVLQFYKDLTLYCYREQISEVIHLGDFFDNRKSLNTKTQHTAHRIAKILALRNLNIKIIIGNHDCYFKNQINPTSLELFNKYNHIDIIDEPTVVDNILLLPWGSPIEYPECTNSAKYCFGHFAINGFHMNDSYICKNGIESATFKDFEVVLSGHFHTPSKQGNITYLGAPYGQTFHDVDGVRGFYTFEDGNLDFIEYPEAPKFKKIRTENYVQAIDENQIKGNVVRLVFDKDYGTIENQNIEDVILKEAPFAYSIDFTKIGSEEAEVDEVRVENRGQMVDVYIESQTYPENIQVNTLKGMFKQIMGEAEEK